MQRCGIGPLQQLLTCKQPVKTGLAVQVPSRTACARCRPAELPGGPLAALDQIEEPERTGCEARSRGGVGAVIETMSVLRAAPTIALLLFGVSASSAGSPHSI